MENEESNVEMVAPKGKTVTRLYSYFIQRFARLGKEIRISPKANVSVNRPGFKTEFFVESVNIVIGIGNDHTADVIMDIDAWKALKEGQKVHVMTTEEFKEKFGK